jgi:hypothetical protein
LGVTAPPPLSADKAGVVRLARDVSNWRSIEVWKQTNLNPQLYLVVVSPGAT